MYLGPDRQVEANVCFLYETLQETPAVLISPEDDMDLNRQTGKSKGEILEEILELQGNLPKVVQLALGRVMTSISWIDLRTSAPRLFIVLPKDLDD